MKISQVTNNDFIPCRIKEAREYRLLSVTELAEKIGKSRQAISQFENGSLKPTPEILFQIAIVTDFPLQYFYKKRLIESTSSSEIPFYRGSISKTRKLKRSYQIVTEWSNDITSYLKDYVILLDVHLPNINFDFNCGTEEYAINKIEQITDNLREYWSLGKGPIHDIVGILENNGFIISKIPYKVHEVEAFSLWYEKIPHIFYEGNRSTPASYIFSIAHELGHLILHQSLTESEASNKVLLKSIEAQANIFAGAFLMPAETFGNEYITSNLNSFLAIKKRWQVSLSAMIMRANILGIIDGQQKSYLYRQLSSHGYRKHEPYEDCIKFVQPAMIYNSIKMILDNKIVSMQDIIDTIALPKDVINALCSLPDNFIEQYLTTSRNKPNLRLITN